MSNRKISQRDARMYKKRVDQLESTMSRMRNAWVREWPGGVHLGSIAVSPETQAIVNTARRLGHAVVCVMHDGNQVAFYGERL